MKLSSKDLKVLHNIAITAAEAAGELIASYAEKDVNVNTKEAGDTLSSQVVTEVDLLSQELILKFLEPTLEQYDLGLLAEESEDDGSRFVKDYFWCIDPLDGTLAFTKKKPGYSVSISLISKSGEPVIGVVFDPVIDNMYHAYKGSGLFKNEQAWTPRIRDTEITIHQGGAVMNACWVLDNAPAIFYKKPKPEKGGGCLWDYGATACLFKEAGFIVTDFYGNKLDFYRKDSVYMNDKGVMFATNKDVAKRAFSNF